MNCRIGLHALLAVGLLCAIARSAPPKVIKAVPDNNQQDVNAATTREIRITFDQPMDRGGGWSIVGGGPTFPKISGRIRWIDDKTISIPVTLEPSHEYWLSINNQNYRNFRSVAGEPAIPYPIAFKTAGGKPRSPKLTPEDNRQAIADLREAIEKDYSHKEIHKVDWDAQFKQFAPDLEKATSPEQFAAIAGKMLASAKDMHIWLKVGEKTFGSHGRTWAGNMNFTLLPKLVPGWTQSGRAIFTGRFEDGVGYVMIASFSPDSLKSLDPVFKVIEQSNGKGLIIDVRPNSGGDEGLAQKIAGCFVTEPQVYARNAHYRDGKFTEPMDAVLEPTSDGPKFKGKVAVLMGEGNMSSAEAFLMMMKQAPAARLFGAPSYGSTGNPRPHPLANGVTVFLPSWKAMSPDGTVREGNPIQPDVVLTSKSSDFATKDPVLEKAMEYVRGRSQ